MNWRSKAQSRQDPLFRFSWDIIIQSPGMELRPEYVEECNLPVASFDSDSVVLQARKWYHAKFEDFGVMTLKFYEDEDCTILKAIQSWQRKIKEVNGDYLLPSEYLGNATVMAKSAQGDTTATFKVRGVFPTRVPPIPFGSSGELVSHDIEFSVNSVELA